MKKRILSVCCLILFLVFIIFIALNQEQYIYKNDEIDIVLEKINLVDDLEILIDNEYFTYELLDETNEDYNATIDLVKPTCLNMNIRNRSFSGFIYKIEEDYIYAVAARHSLIHVNEPLNIIFFNDETLSTNIEYKTLKNVTDLGLFRFKTSNVPKDLLYSLKQVCLDIEYTSQLTDNQNLIEYSENHVYPFATSQKIKLVKIKNPNETNHGWPFSDSMITTTRGGIAGMSGCGVFDYQGRVVGIASHISNITKLDYLARFDRIVELETNLREND